LPVFAIWIKSSLVSHKETLQVDLPRGPTWGGSLRERCSLKLYIWRVRGRGLKQWFGFLCGNALQGNPPYQLHLTMLTSPQEPPKSSIGRSPLIYSWSPSTFPIGITSRSYPEPWDGKTDQNTVLSETAEFEHQMTRRRTILMSS
jgi:hypothetical protein